MGGKGWIALQERGFSRVSGLGLDGILNFCKVMREGERSQKLEEVRRGRGEETNGGFGKGEERNELRTT